MTRPLLCLVAVTAISAAAGCSSGVQPGDTVVYRIAYAAPELASSCYGGAIPVNQQNDGSTLRKSATVVLYAGGSDQLYLDTGDTVLEGSAADKVYTFDGKQVNIEFTQPNGQGAKVTKTVTTHVEMTVDSEAVTGTRTDKEAQKCAGGAFGECNPFPTASCTETMDFVGTQVDNVDIKHDI
jgi:hypothetical protein